MRKEYLFLSFFAVLLLGVNLVLIYPYLLQSAPDWIESIEVSFITIGRWWAQNFPHIFWNPYWYAGFPMRFSYVPLLPVSTALLGSLIGDFGQAYHLLAGLAYALVPVSLFFFIRYLTKNSLIAFAGALIFSLSPTLGNIFAHVRAAQGLFGQTNLPPWRMMVMVFYGEGPHTLSQVFLPLAGLFYFQALKEKKYSQLLLTALMISLAALSNPIGLWAVGILLGSIFLVFFLWEKDKQSILKHSLIIAVLAYLFSAFWYTPGFIKNDLMSEGGGLFSSLLVYSFWFIILVAIAFGFVLVLMKKYIKSSLIASVFLWFLITFFIVAVFYLYGIEFAPQARRYIPELDMAGVTILALGITQAVKLLKERNGRLLAKGLPVMIILLIIFSTLHAWQATWWFITRNEEREIFLEPKMIDYLQSLTQPTQRVFVSSNYTFWLNFLSDIWQIRGGHWQASIHPWQAHAAYQITSGEDGETSLYWLKTFAIDWLVVSMPSSPIHYSDYQYPKKFEKLLGEPEGAPYPTEKVYRVPLIHGLVGPVFLARMKNIEPPVNGADKEALSHYVDWLEASDSQFSLKMINNDHYEIQGEFAEGEGIRVAMAYDRGFRAQDEQGKKKRLLRDPLGFLIIDPGEAPPQKIILTYGPTFDFFLGWFFFSAGIGGTILIKKKGWHG
jgi:hypothetical protein